MFIPGRVPVLFHRTRFSRNSRERNLQWHGGLDFRQTNGGTNMTESEFEDWTGRPGAAAVTTKQIVPNPLLDKALANVRVTKDGRGMGVCLDLKGIYVYSAGVVVQFADGTQLPYDDRKDMLVELDHLLQKAQVKADGVTKKRAQFESAMTRVLNGPAYGATGEPPAV
jgi:hypothetical protein